MQARQPRSFEARIRRPQIHAVAALKSLLLFTVLNLVPLPAAVANEDALVVREAVVYSAASSASPKVGRLEAGTRVSVFSRRGGWKEVFSEQRAIVGWVRSYQVRAGEFATETAEEPDSRGFLSGLAAFSRRASSLFSASSGRTSSGTATIGVRGLSEQQIESAEPDFEQLERMKNHVSNAARVSSFSTDGGLRSLEVDYLQPKITRARQRPKTDK